jgi:hypothetical protein
MKKSIFLFSLQMFFIFSMAQYVTLSGNQFRLNGNNFYPMAMNYGVQMVSNDGVFFLSPDRCYITNDFECGNTTTCDAQIQRDLNYIAGMGFNTLRIIGLDPDYLPGQGLVFKCTVNDHASPPHQHFELPIYPSHNSDPGMLTILSLYDKILELAHNASLKVIFNITGKKQTLDNTEINTWGEFLAAVASHFSNSAHNNALLAYDLINEPGYTITPDKTKQEACEIISTWYDAIKANDPHHLVTIGNYGLTDIFSFDPSILKVDFNSFHFYPSFRFYEDRTDPLIQELARKRMANYLYWAQQVSIVPWIIGETGFTASISHGIHEGLEGTLADQGDYVQFTLDAVCNCGGRGYSWWQYQDVFWGNPGSDFIGLLERNFVPSPVAEKQLAVNYFRNYTPQITGDCPVDYSPTFNANKLYYNPYQYPQTNNDIARYVKDQDGNPIKDAVVRIWTSVDPYGYHTFTDANGYFKVISPPQSSNAKIAMIWVSAAGADIYKSIWNNNGTFVPNTVYLNKIKDDVVVSGVTVLNGQSKTYKGRKSLTVSNTTINSGGNATFTSQKSVILLPGFVAQAGSHAYLYIAPPDCNEMSLRDESAESIVFNTVTPKSLPKSAQIELSFETDFSENYISVFPNPSNSTITVQLHSSNPESSLTSIRFMDMLGRELLLQQVNGQSYTIDISFYVKGVYFIEIKDINKTYHKKIIIN